MTESHLQNRLEALLFYKGEPLKKANIATLLAVSPRELDETITALKAALSGRGITVIEEGDTLALGTAPLAKELIEAVRKEELEGPLGKAGLETLAVVMYQGPVSRADIEYVRGVNCSSILRSLTMRGLIEKKENPKDKRGYIYQTTPELAAHLGITSVKNMPEYETLRANVDAVLAARDEEKHDDKE